jgi:nodulation protein F
MADAGWTHDFEVLLRENLPLAGAGDVLAAETPLFDLGLDSLGITCLVVGLENMFGIEFTDTLITNRTFATAGVLWDTVQKLRQGEAAS